MMGYFAYFQFVKSEDFINSPYNKRQDLFARKVTRGEIISADGRILAETITDTDGTETRYYPYANMFAHVVGFSTNGKSGLESIANFNLLLPLMPVPEDIPLPDLRFPAWSILFLLHTEYIPQSLL